MIQRLTRYWVFIIWMGVWLASCQVRPGDVKRIEVGAGRVEVRAQLGEPDRVQEFRLPEVPFFGPQESLTNLIPAGTLVEEWVYVMGEDELYIWFSGDEGQARNGWRVIATGRYPVGAVY